MSDELDELLDAAVGDALEHKKDCPYCQAGQPLKCSDYMGIVRRVVGLSARKAFPPRDPAEQARRTEELHKAMGRHATPPKDWPRG